MAIYRSVGGVNREVKEQYRCVDGVNRQIKEQYRCVDGVNRLVFGKRYLYRDGDECVDVTGGWDSYWATGTYYTSFNKMIKNANNLYGSFQAAQFRMYSLATNDLIDLSQYTKVMAKCNMATASGDAVASLFVSTDNTATGNNVASASTKNETGEITLSVDLSSLNAEYYIVVSFSCGSTITNLTGYFTEVWLE